MAVRLAASVVTGRVSPLVADVHTSAANVPKPVSCLLAAPHTADTIAVTDTVDRANSALSVSDRVADAHTAAAASFASVP